MYEVLTATLEVCDIACEKPTLDKLLNMILTLPEGKTEDEISRKIKEDSYYRDVAIKAWNANDIRDEEFDLSLPEEEREWRTQDGGALIGEYIARREAAFPEIPRLRKAHEFLLLEYGLLDKDTRAAFDHAFSEFVSMTQHDTDFPSLCIYKNQKTETVQDRMNAALDEEKLRQYFLQKNSMTDTSATT